MSSPTLNTGFVLSPANSPALRTGSGLQRSSVSMCKKHIHQTLHSTSIIISYKMVLRVHGSFSWKQICYTLSSSIEKPIQIQDLMELIFPSLTWVVCESGKPAMKSRSCNVLHSLDCLALRARVIMPRKWRLFPWPKIIIKIRHFLYLGEQLESWKILQC